MDAGDTWDSPKCKKIRHVKKIRQLLSSYKGFADIAQDLRDTKFDAERVSTFSNRVETFIKELVCNGISACVAKIPYLHLLRNHVPFVMDTFCPIFSWGYGYFSTNGGEHLNKRVKYYESSAMVIGFRI